MFLGTIRKHLTSQRGAVKLKMSILEPKGMDRMDFVRRILVQIWEKENRWNWPLFQNFIYFTRCLARTFSQAPPSRRAILPSHQ